MKKAFTFAEVLLVLMIIGILISLCMGAGQVSLRNAYNLHYYRTFYALTAAFDNFIYLKKHEQTLDNGETGPVSNLASAFQSHLDSLIVNEYDKMGASFSVSPLNDPFYDSVTVTVPTIKTKDNQTGTTTYYAIFHCGYLRTAYGDKQAGDASGYAPILILIGSDKSGSTYSLSQSNTNITDNIGVLPTYADNGTIGRHLTGQTYEPIFPRTYRESLCSSVDTSDENSVLNEATDNFNINTYCSGVTIGAEKYKGATVVLIPPSNMR